jgi:hypothetical protein
MVIPLQYAFSMRAQAATPGDNVRNLQMLYFSHCPQYGHSLILQLSVFAAEPPSRPEQSLPPWAMPSHVRVEVLVPSPHVVEHEPAVQPDHAPLTGHAWVLQLRLSVVEPTQALPPKALPSQVRVRDCVPMAQLLEQVLYAV